MSPKDDNDSNHNSAATSMTQQSHPIPQQPSQQQPSQQQTHPQPHEEEDVTSQRSHYSHQSFQSADDSSSSFTGCFFADMTLDLREAHLEATPRTDRRYAALAEEGILMEGEEEEELGGGGMISPLPLLGGEKVDCVEGDTDGAKHKHNGIENETEHEHDATTSAMESTTLTTEPRDNSKIPSPLEMEDRTFARITGGGETFKGGGSVDSSSSHGFRSRLAPPRPRPPRRPRDVSWTAAASLILPLGLIVPHFYYSAGYVARHNHLCDDEKIQTLPGCTVLHPSWASTAHYSASHHTIFLSSLLSTLLSILLLRRLYSSPGGGDGDDARHAIVTRTFLLSSHASVAIHPLLAGAIGYWLPGARHAALLPLGLFARDVYRARSAGGGNGGALPVFRGGGRTGASSSSSSHDRQTFFRALACAALDILSRSLRRKSFVRASTALMILQFLCVTSWWSAVRAVLAAKVFLADGVVARWVHGAWLTVALVAGKWATGTIARVLGFVASGGVASWFAQQTWMIEERNEKERREREEALEGPKKTEASSGTNDYDSSEAAAKAARHAMPEAYRATDASAYAPVMDFDDGLDDDYDDDGDVDPRDSLATTAADVYSWGHSATQTAHHPSAVKTFLAAAATTGFGSVAQCGLLGGLAQFLWSVVRNADAMGLFLAGRFARNSSGFRGMDISVDASASGSFSSPRQWRLKIAFYWRKLDVAIRGFVRSHSDLAMSHVAAYYKSYQRAANDVAALIEASGVEPIIHDDITTHMCSSVCTLVSGTIVLLFGMLLTTHRNITTAGSSAENYLTDVSLLEVLLFTYILCYTLVFTALEPLRAAIKAVYVCFAEHPMSLSQAFPLIYQRLSRISEASGPVV